MHHKILKGQEATFNLYPPVTKELANVVTTSPARSMLWMERWDEKVVKQLCKRLERWKGSERCQEATTEQTGQMMFQKDRLHFQFGGINLAVGISATRESHEVTHTRRRASMPALPLERPRLLASYSLCRQTSFNPSPSLALKAKERNANLCKVISATAEFEVQWSISGRD